MKKLTRQSLQFVTIIATSDIYSTDIYASIVKQYSLVLLKVDNMPYCRGILIGKNAFTAAHCVKHDKESSILYIKDGQQLTAKPSKIVNLANDRNHTHPRDIAVLMFDSTIDGDVDGSIDVSPRAVNAKSTFSQRYYFADKWSFQPKDQSFVLAKNRKIYLYQRGYTKNQLAFSLNSSRGVLGYISDLNVTDKKKDSFQGTDFEASQSTSICHGHSGSPVFSESQGVSQLVGIATAIDSSLVDKERKECSDLFLADKVDAVLDEYLNPSSD